MDNEDLNELRNRMLQFLYERLDYESSTKEIMKAIEFVEARIEQSPNELMEKIDLKEMAKKIAPLIDKELGKAQERKKRESEG